MRRRTLLLAALCCALATACGDQSVTSPTSGKSTLAATVSLDEQINALIDASFPTGLRTAAHARWNNVKRQLVRTTKGPSQASKQQHLNLVDWIQKQQGQLRPPGGETAEHAAARVVLLMSLYVYNGEDYQPPVVVTPTADVTLAVVTPSTTTETSVVTPTERAAVTFPPGSVTEPTVIVIAQETVNYPENCSGPLDTRYCQYPQFYEFNVFPDVHLPVPAKVEVCHINSGAARRPLPGSEHDEYRIAHDRPADPANYTEGATQIDGIEILPYVTTGSLANCGSTSYAASLLNRPDNLLTRFAARVLRAVTPKSAWAIDQGGGGEVSFFSHFAIVDPHSQPDLAPAQAFTLSATSALPGTAITINPWTVLDTGTAASRYSVVPVIATDSLLTVDAQNLAEPVASSNALAPRQDGAAQPAQTVTIPASLPAGTYFLGVRVIPSGPLPDLRPENNVVSARITLGDAVTHVCPVEGEDPYTVLTAGVNATAPGGTMFICDGTFRVDTTVKVNKPMTIRPEHLHGTTLADNWAGGFSQQGQAVFMVRHAAGPVRVVDLTFSIRGRGVVGDTDFVRLDVDSSRFISRGDTLGIGVMTNRVPGVGVVDVTRSYFERLTIGFFAVGDNESNMHRSTSVDMYGSTMTWSNSTAHGVVEDNEIQCGAAGCIRIINAGNTIIRRNTIDGRDKAVIGQAAIAIIPNAVEAHTPIIVEDNTILSARVPATDSTLSTGWTVVTAISVQDVTPTVHVVRRNDISSAFRAFQINGSADIHDNTVTRGFFAFQGGAQPATIARNDFLQLGRSFAVPSNSTGDFRCNWWDSASGPSNPPITTAKYWPWAMQPVAGNSSACNPDVDQLTVRACPDQPLGGDPWNFGSVPAAYNGVAAGGTVNVCDGTQVVQNLFLNKSVTLQATGPGMPVLDGGGANFVLNRGGGNTVTTIRGLRFRNAAQHLVVVGNNSGTFLAENNVFEPKESFAYNADLGTYQEAWWSGLGVFQAVGTVTIRNNTFLGGDIGVHINPTGTTVGPANVTVLNNQFTGQVNAGLFTGGSNAQYLLHAEGNTFDQCGRMGCTKFFGTGGRGEYVNNQFNVDASRHAFFAINAFNPGGSLQFNGNQVVGTGGSGSRNSTLSYAIDGVAIQVRGTAEVSGNTVSDAWGLVFVSDATVTGTDNIASRLGYVVSSDGSPGLVNRVTINRSDITDYNQFVQNTPFALLNLQCNWWGSAAGPTNTGTTSASVYTPFATQSIAKKPGVVCP